MAPRFTPSPLVEKKNAFTGNYEGKYLIQVKLNLCTFMCITKFEPL